MSQCLTPVMYTVHRIHLLASLRDTIFVLGISSVQIARENCAMLIISSYAILLVWRSEIVLPKWNIGTYCSKQYNTVPLTPSGFHMRFFMLKSGYLCVLTFANPSYASYLLSKKESADCLSRSPLSKIFLCGIVIRDITMKTPPFQDSKMSQRTTRTYQTGFYRLISYERQLNCSVTSRCKGVTLQTAFAKRNSKKMCVQKILN